ELLRHGSAGELTRVRAPEEGLISAGTECTAVIEARREPRFGALDDQGPVLRVPVRVADPGVEHEEAREHLAGAIPVGVAGTGLASQHTLDPVQVMACAVPRPHHDGDVLESRESGEEHIPALELAVVRHYVRGDAPRLPGAS